MREQWIASKSPRLGRLVQYKLGLLDCQWSSRYGPVEWLSTAISKENRAWHMRLLAVGSPQVLAAPSPLGGANTCSVGIILNHWESAVFPEIIAQPERAQYDPFGL